MNQKMQKKFCTLALKKFPLISVPTLTSENLWDFTFNSLFRQPFDEAFMKDR